MCVEQGLVSGRKQCLDSALIKANASLDSLQPKQPIQPLDSATESIGELPSAQTDSTQEQPRRKAQFDKSPVDQRSLSAPQHQLQELLTRQQH
jgi:hypothetical protein